MSNERISQARLDELVEHATTAVNTKADERVRMKALEAIEADLFDLARVVLELKLHREREQRLNDELLAEENDAQYCTDMDDKRSANQHRQRADVLRRIRDGK